MRRKTHIGRLVEVVGIGGKQSGPWGKIAVVGRLPGLGDEGAVRLSVAERVYSVSPATASTPLGVSGDRRRKWAPRYARTLFILDAVVVSLSTFAALKVRFGDTRAVLSAAEGSLLLSATYSSISFGLGLVWMLSLHLHQTRSLKVIGAGGQEYKVVALATFRVFILVAIVAYILKADLARGYVAVALPLGMAGLLLERWLARKWLMRGRNNGRCMSSVILVGDALHVAPHLLTLTRSPASGFKVVGVCVPADERTQIEGLAPFLGRPEEAAEVAIRHEVDGVIVSSTAQSGPSLLKQIAWDVEGADIDLLVASALTDVAGPRIHTRPVDGLPLMHIEEPQFEGGARVAKAVFDRVGAGLALILLSPLFMLVAFLIRVTSDGPAFYRQERVGRNGETFRIWKFRSMRTDADAELMKRLRAQGTHNQPLFKVVDDDRVTPLGHYLRKFSIDELPQLINVLAGDMSLVGPRPQRPAEVALYDSAAHRRLKTKPGLTGLWQVSGRSDLPWEEAVRLDLYYVENWSFIFDLLLIWRTVFTVLRASGAR